MRCLVRQFRRRGRRVSDREFNTMEPIVANLSTHYITHANTRYHVATLYAPNDSLCVDLVPPLYEPALVGAGHGILVLRGYEHIGENGYVQEWHCQVQ